MAIKYSGEGVRDTDGNILVGVENGQVTGACAVGGRRNLIINGAMQVAQRGTSFTPSGGSYTVDRWSYDPSAGLSWYTFIQNGDSLTPPAGFANYIAITSTGANTPTSSQFSVFRQPIEGLNTAQLAWGTSDAKDITISFWVRSSLTGTFAGSLRNSAANYTYPFTYSISSANTWEKKTVTIAGPTSGTWLTTNGVGVLIGFNLGSGSNFASTANTWTASWSQTATGSVNISETNGAKLYLTGVQLEVGSVATPFEHRSYGEELALCQRYYQRWNATTTGAFFGNGYVAATTLAYFTVRFPEMRIAPTSLEYSGTASDYQLSNGSGFTTATGAVELNNSEKWSMRFQAPASGLTQGRAVVLRSVNTDAYIAWSAEL